VDRLVLNDLESVNSRPGFSGLVARLPKQPPEGVTHTRLVIHNEDGSLRA
jgi:hypothetical protein